MGCTKGGEGEAERKRGVDVVQYGEPQTRLKHLQGSINGFMGYTKGEQREADRKRGVDVVHLFGE